MSSDAAGIHVTTREKILSLLNLIVYRIRLILAIRRTFINYREVIGNIRSNRYPFCAYLRHGNNNAEGYGRDGDGRSAGKVTIRSFAVCHFLINARSASQIIHYDLDSDTVQCILDGGRKIILEKGISNGDVPGIYVHNEYKYLPVKDRVVVDIGANIADSAIHFCAKGAKKVIALEPFPYMYRNAVRNVAANNMQDKIIMINAGCSAPSPPYQFSSHKTNTSRGSSNCGDNDDDGGYDDNGSRGDEEGRGGGNSIVVDPNFMSNAGSVLSAHSEGTEVPLYSLAQLISTYDIGSNSVLKVDCEGCEYDVILMSPDTVLRRFAYMQVEYHHGYSLLKKRLEAAGFKVNVSSPLRALNHNTGSVMHVGWLYAKRL